MSDGDEESEPEAPDETTEIAEDLDVETLEEKLDDAADALEAAETETDLDDVEARLDQIESNIEEADLQAPDEEADDAEDPQEALESRLEELRDELEEQRGPYADDVVGDVEDAQATVSESRWTDEGEADLAETVGDFLEAVQDTLDADFGAVEHDVDALADQLGDAAAAVADAGLDPDADADTIEELVAIAEELTAGVEDAQAFADLSVRDQLDYEGFYAPLEDNKHKDYPPEWSALKAWEKRDDAEMVLLLLEKMGEQGHLERHCLESLERMGNREALAEVGERAARRDLTAISIVGKIGVVEGLEHVREFTESDSNPELQKTAIKAVGEIGSEEATQDVADQLAAENDGVRSQAARALGMIGDTRAVDPLADVLADDEEAAAVRASAAWALYQIGTEDALECAAEYADDRSFLVQTEAEKSAEALDAAAPTA